MEGIGGFECQENEDVDKTHFKVGVGSVQNGRQSVRVKDTCMVGEEHVGGGGIVFFGGGVGGKGVGQGLEGAPHASRLGLEGVRVELTVGWVRTKDAHVEGVGTKARKKVAVLGGNVAKLWMVFVTSGCGWVWVGGALDFFVCCGSSDGVFSASICKVCARASRGGERTWRDAGQAPAASVARSAAPAPR